MIETEVKLLNKETKKFKKICPVCKKSDWFGTIFGKNCYPCMDKYFKKLDGKVLK